MTKVRDPAKPNPRNLREQHRQNQNDETGISPKNQSRGGQCHRQRHAKPFHPKALKFRLGELQRPLPAILPENREPKEQLKLLNPATTTLFTQNTLRYRSLS